MNEQLIQEMIEAIQANPELGVGGVAGIALAYVVRIVKLPLVQSFIPRRFRWERLSPLARFGLPFALAAVGALLVAWLGGIAWPAAIAGAVTAGLAAVSTHMGTKAVGASLDMRAVNADPMAETGKWGRLGIIPPLDRDRALAAIHSRDRVEPK